MDRPTKKRDSGVISEARTAFSAAFAAVLEHNQTNPNAVAGAMKKRKSTKKAPSQKTLANMLNGSHPHQIGNMEAVAEYFGVPLWMMVLPGIRPEMLQNPLKARIEALMADYLACNSEGRAATENMASAHAALRRGSAQKTHD